MMWKQSVWTSIIAASLASSHLKEGGLLTLTGAEAALSGTPGKIFEDYAMLTREFCLRQARLMWLAY